MRRNHAFLFVIIVVAFAVSPVWAQEKASPGQPIPTWVAWKVFYASLDFYGKRSQQQDTRIVTEQFRLTPGQSATLLNGGRSFLANIEHIDAEAKAVAAERYKYVPLQSGKPAPGQPQSRPAGTQKNIRDRAIQDGFAAEIEAKKNASLANHIAGLKRDVGEAKLDEIRNFVETSLALQIKSTPAPDFRSTGNPGLPPGITGETPIAPMKAR